jgi:hypothetical protein
MRIPLATLDARDYYGLSIDYDNICKICGQKFARGITLEYYEDGFAHPECAEGKRTGRHIPIDHGD